MSEPATVAADLFDHLPSLVVKHASSSLSRSLASSSVPTFKMIPNQNETVRNQNETASRRLDVDTSSESLRRPSWSSSGPPHRRSFLGGLALTTQTEEQVVEELGDSSPNSLPSNSLPSLASDQDEPQEPCHTIENGMHLITKVKPKHGLRQALAHHRLPIKFYTNGKLSSEAFQKYLDQLPIHMRDAPHRRDLHASSSLPSAQAANPDSETPSQFHLSSKQGDADTLLCLDRNQHVHLYDLSGPLVPTSPSQTYTLHFEISQLVLLEKLGLYVGCNQDTNVRFFDPRFDYLSSISMSYPIVFLRYASFLNLVVVCGVDEVTLVRVEPFVRVGSLCLKTTIVWSGLRPFDAHKRHRDVWIKDVYVQEKAPIMYVIANDELFVYHMTKYKQLANVRITKKAHITCLYFCDALQWLLVGLSDGRGRS